MYSFKKSERLNNQEAINQLFLKGQAIERDPFLLVWTENINNKNIPLQILITIPKNNVKLAAKRNSIKRRINEALRLNKSKLYFKLEEKSKQINVAVVYKKQKIKTYSYIEDKINLLLGRLIKQL